MFNQRPETILFVVNKYYHESGWTRGSGHDLPDFVGLVSVYIIFESGQHFGFYFHCRVKN